MTIAAVAVLQTITRNEFERDWHDSEDFDWIQGRDWEDPPAEPVKEIIVELEGKNYAFPSTEIVATIKQWEEYFRWEVENEDHDEDEDDGSPFSWNFPSEEEIEEKVWEQVVQHFMAQLDNATEAEAVITCRGEYFVKGFEELVAHFQMVGERVPELRPVLAQKLQEAHDQTVAILQRWIDEMDPTGSL